MARFEIVRTDVGHHARMQGDNHEIVWTTEVYTTFNAAQDAIRFLCTELVPNYGIDFDNNRVTLNLDTDPLGDKLSIPVAWVDERGKNSVAYRTDDGRGQE